MVKSGAIDKSLARNFLNTRSADKWQRIGLSKRAGILAPLFCVYSKKSLGIGDFRDLKLLIDWAGITGNSIIQLLPMNETGPVFCPYDSVSSFALEPSYISIDLIPFLDVNYLKAKVSAVRKMFDPGASHVDYRIKKEKIRLLWDIFNSTGKYPPLFSSKTKQGGKKNTFPYHLRNWSSDSDELWRAESSGRRPVSCKEGRASSGFEKFLLDNAYWLSDFALFKVLKGSQGQRPWYEWEEKYKNRDKCELEKFNREHEKEISFQAWIQWQLYKQFREAKAYAGSKKVLIKGDLPVLVSRDSADVWAHPEFFKLEFASGAPPDMYCAKGQRWGMPTYNWQSISADNYNYLQQKIKYAENFYDILRIDHVVGLFRIWSIPYNEPFESQGLHGFFDPKDEGKWEEHGRNILSVMLDATKMLLCAEDLGVIPKACPKVLGELGMPGNDVQRWVKDWNVKHDFLDPQDYRELSVAVLSTHDTTNWAAWWENEAGTVDEAFFIRKCLEANIDYNNVKTKFFDSNLSRHGRLRWQESVSSVDSLARILGREKKDIGVIIDAYLNTYHEKENFLRILKIKDPVKEKSNSGILKSALAMALESKAIFSIHLIIDWLGLAKIFQGDPYQYRVNTPGTVSPDNWSLVMPISLDELLKHKVCQEIRNMIVVSGRLEDTA